MNVNWIFVAFLVASVLHMVEEYLLPGGFTEFMKSLNPRIASYITNTAIIGINGLQIFLCIVVLLTREKYLTFSMSLAALLFLNSLMHIGGSILTKGYAPGVITGTLLYLPISLFAYNYFWKAGQLSLTDGILSLGLGILYQTIPPIFFGLSSAIGRKNSI